MVKIEKASTTATSNATVNYDLPLWDGTDITSWQGNLNDAMNKIDSAIWNVQEQMNGYNKTAENLKEIADNISADNTGIKQQITSLQEEFGTLNASLSEVKSQLEDTKQAVVNLDTEQESNQHMIEALQDDVGKLALFQNGIIIPKSFTLTSTDNANTIEGSSVFRSGGNIGFVFTGFNGTFPAGDTKYVTSELTEILKQLGVMDILGTHEFRRHIKGGELGCSIKHNYEVTVTVYNETDEEFSTDFVGALMCVIVTRDQEVV